MKKILDIITAKMQKAFEEAGYDASFGRVTVSNRPDLCEYQCNGAMAAVKVYRKAPIMIANDVVAALQESKCIEKVIVISGFKMKKSPFHSFFHIIQTKQKHFLYFKYKGR